MNVNYRAFHLIKDAEGDLLVQGLERHLWPCQDGKDARHLEGMDHECPGLVLEESYRSWN
jgi:hypothetical protein